METLENKYNNRSWRPASYFAPKKGWINDPNGLIYFRKQYHLFYQYNPYHCNWDSMHWGHAVSNDLLHWEEMGIALYPDQPYDNHPEGGCFSGSVINKNNKLYAFYTGTIKENDNLKQTQCLAISDDGIHFKKVQENPLIIQHPEGEGPDFRDPKVFWAEGKWRMVCGGSDGSADDRKSTGKIYMYSSEDLFSWEYQGIIYESAACSMFECPDVFPLDGKWVITSSPMNRTDYAPNIYMVGNIDFENAVFYKEKEGVLDGGTHYYAPQTYQDKEGKWQTIAWLGGWKWMPWMDDFGPTDQEGFRGIISIPRYLYLDDKKYVCSYPAVDILPIGHEGRHDFALMAGDAIKVIDETIEPFQIKCSVDFSKSKTGSVKWILKEGDSCQVIFEMNIKDGTFKADFTQADIHSRRGIRKMDCEFDSSFIDMEIIRDGCVIQFFFNKGRYSFTTLLYPETRILSLEIIE